MASSPIERRRGISDLKCAAVVAEGWRRGKDNGSRRETVDSGARAAPELLRLNAFVCSYADEYYAWYDAGPTRELGFDRFKCAMARWTF